MKQNRRLWLALLATGLWLVFIYSRSLQPADRSNAESSTVLQLLRQVFPFLTMKLVRKLAHFTEFFFLGSLLFLDWRLLGRGKAALPLAAGLVFAAADEFLQTFIPGRSGEVRDVLLDFSGVAAAVCAAAGILLLKRRLHHGS